MLIKSIHSAIALKDIDVKQGLVSGYFAAFGSKDSDGDIIVKGAFANSIAKNGPQSNSPRIKHLLDHDRRNAVAVIQELKEDDFGLAYVSKAGRHKNGQDFLLMAEDGIITEHSHGFVVVKEQQKSDANYIEESNLYEGSSLQFWGANGNTPVTGVKSFEEVFDSLVILEKGFRNGKYTDETFIKLEGKIKSLYGYLESIKQPEEKSIYSLLTTK